MQSALAPRPQVILLDEPFASLDSALRSSLRADLRRILHACAMTAVLVTHDQEEALSMADRMGVMCRGRIIQSGTPVEVYREPKDPEVARLLGNGNFLEAQIDRGTVRCELGEFAASERQPGGACRVFVRAESLRITAVSNGSACVVEDCAYYGHDQIAVVRSLTGQPLCVRLGPNDRIRRGDRVGVALCGPGMVYSSGRCFRAVPRPARSRAGRDDLLEQRSWHS